MSPDDINKQSFINTLCRISSVSEQYADAAWYTISAKPTMSPERQARIYAGLYGLGDKP